MKFNPANAIKVFAGNSLQIIIETNTIAMVLMVVFTSMGAWKYFVSSMQAFNVRQVVAMSEPPAEISRVVVVAVTDRGYEAHFEAQSPVGRERMLSLLQTIDANLPEEARVAVDIDLSDTGQQTQEQKALDEFVLQRPARWVLPAIQPEGTGDFARVSTWRNQLCNAGVQFGLPYVPTEFGYPALAYEYKHSLAYQLGKPGQLNCLDPTAEFEQVEMPVQPHYLNNGVVIPFDGDLDALGQMLQFMQPEAVFVGGMWGQQDIFATPFGDRFGVQIHAAAHAGALLDLRLTSLSAQLLLGWFFMSLLAMMVLLVGKLLRRLGQYGQPDWPGHRFYKEGAVPVLIVALVITALYGWISLLAVVYAKTGYWISASEVCAFVLGALVFNWNFGRDEPSQFSSWEDVKESLVPGEMTASLKSAFTSLKAIFARDEARPVKAPVPVLVFEILTSLGAAGLGLFMTIASSLFVISLFASEWFGVTIPGL